MSRELTSVAKFLCLKLLLIREGIMISTLIVNQHKCHWRWLHKVVRQLLSRIQDPPRVCLWQCVCVCKCVSSCMKSGALRMWVGIFGARSSRLMSWPLTSACVTASQDPYAYKEAARALKLEFRNAKICCVLVENVVRSHLKCETHIFYTGSN